jgi:hypothetical protein
MVWFADRLRGILAVATWLGAFDRNAKMVYGWGVVGVLLPCALGQNLSSKDHGFSIAISRSMRFCYIRSEFLFLRHRMVRAHARCFSNTSHSLSSDWRKGGTINNTDYLGRGGIAAWRQCSQVPPFIESLKLEFPFVHSVNNETACKIEF